MALLLELQNQPLLHQHSAQLVGFNTKCLKIESADVKLAYETAHAGVALLSAVRALRNANLAAAAAATSAAHGRIKFAGVDVGISAELAAAKFGSCTLLAVRGFAGRKNGSDALGNGGNVRVVGFLKT